VSLLTTTELLWLESCDSYMYSLEEAAAEHENRESNKSRAVISRLPSFKSKAVTLRSPTFFKNLFSSTNSRSKVGIANQDSDDDEGDNDEKAEDETKLSNDQQQEGKREGMSDEDSYDADLDQKFSSDPLMPNMAKPIDINRLINRNRHAEEGMNALMAMVNEDVALALYNAQHIPVSKEIDRVTVTPEASAYMAKVRTKGGIEKRLKSHTTEIQKTLNYRKSALIMMNANYSNELVRKIEPIYVNEARTIVHFK